MENTVNENKDYQESQKEQGNINEDCNLTSDKIKEQVSGILKVLKPINKERYFIKATGTFELSYKYGEFINEKQVIGKGETKYIGCFSSNNGTLAFIDEYGEYWVCQKNDEAIKELLSAGYNNVGAMAFYIPHSNDGGEWLTRKREVKLVSKKHSGFFIHGIPEFVPGDNSILREGISIEDKIRLCVSLSPTLSTSFIKKGQDERYMWSEKAGLILSGGIINGAFAYDSRTVAKVGGKKYKNQNDLVSEIDKVINTDKTGFNSGSLYNEFIVSYPEFLGIYIGYEILRNSEENIKFVRLSKDLNLPVYLITYGMIFPLKISRKTGLLECKKRSSIKNLSNIKISRKKLSKKQPVDEIFDSVVQKTMPFDISRISKDAQYLWTKSYGEQLYMLLYVKEYGIDKLKELENIKIYFPDGNIFGFDGEGFLNRHFHISNYIKIQGTYQNSVELGRKIDSITSYLESMSLKLREINLKNSEFSKALAFHLYGFAEMAKKFGDEITYNNAINIANKFLSLEEYNILKNKWLDNEGRFILTRDKFMELEEIY